MRLMLKLTLLFCNRYLSPFYFAYGLSFFAAENGHRFLFITGIFCLVDGTHKKDTKETLIGVAILICAVVKLVTGREKRPLNNDKEHDKPNITGRS
ncbi:MAG: hypothetical protein JWQ57_4294 [Mucilaginibacter sp.]|nr:hypothetical protein [Mucilaginibacter sp.]